MPGEGAANKLTVGRMVDYYPATQTNAIQLEDSAGTVLFNLTSAGGLTVTSMDDDAVFSFGTVARFSWDTTDANANALLLQLPAGGAVDVPVVVIGQSIESVDLGLYNGVVDPRIALIGVGAVATGPVIEFRKARGTAAAPTVVTSGDDLGTLDFYGAVAAGEYVRAASIRADMAGTIATTRGPGTLTFLTATDAAPSVLTTALTIGADQGATFAGVITSEAGIAVNDDTLLTIGTGSIARMSWDTTDANANALLLQLPPGGATDVPVLAIGQSIESVDLGLYNGVVDPRVAMFGVGAVATGPVLELRKARGTIAAPTVVTSGDDMGSIDFHGAVAAGEYVRGARILAEMTGTIATTRGPGVLSFQTATDAAPSVLTTALQLTAAQAVEVPVGPVNIGVTGSATGILNLDGATSGTVSVTVAAAAGTWTMTLPTAVGGAGQQLTDAGGDGVTSWAAAGSQRELKNVLGVINDRADQVLERIRGLNVYAFRYKDGMGTQDSETEYHGVMADEAPEFMHYGGNIVNPVNTLGDLILAIKALSNQVDRIEAALT